MSAECFSIFAWCIYSGAFGTWLLISLRICISIMKFRYLHHLIHRIINIRIILILYYGYLIFIQVPLRWTKIFIKKDFKMNMWATQSKIRAMSRKLWTKYQLTETNVDQYLLLVSKTTYTSMYTERYTYNTNNIDMHECVCVFCGRIHNMSRTRECVLLVVWWEATFEAAFKLTWS